MKNKHWSESQPHLFGAFEDPDNGFQYIAMRDGVLLSAMIRFPTQPYMEKFHPPLSVIPDTSSRSDGRTEV